jgi:DNA polymerase-3 subunit delta
LTYEAIIKDLKAKKYHPVYFLHGQESYFIDQISKYIEKNVLEESEKAFNQTVVYGKEVDAKSLIDIASRYPMMAPYQVVILKEAQEMRTLKDLQPYLEHAVPTTILVIAHKHKKFDSRTKFGKTLKDKAVVFESKPLYDNKVPGWIEAHLRGLHYGIQPDAAELIAEYLGADLSKIANELEKMMLNLPEQTLITSKHVQDLIGISKDYNVFELQKAIGFRDVVKTFRIVNHFSANPKGHPLVVVLASLYNYFSKILVYQSMPQASDRELQTALNLHSAFFLKEYRQSARNFSRQKTIEVISLLKEYDLKSKGVGNVSTPDGELLRELVIRILN